MADDDRRRPPEDPGSGSPAADDVSVAAVAADLHVATMRLARRLRAEHVDELTSTQLSTLAALWRSGPLAIGDLAALERVKAPSMTRTVGTLVAMGLAERRPSPEDARLVMVHITAAGEQTIATVRSARRAWLSTRLAELDSEDLKVVRRAAEIMGRVAR